MRRLATCTLGIVLGGALIAAAPGCSDDEQQIGRTLGELRRAYLVEDYRKVCSLMSESARREIGSLGHAQPTSCPRDVALNMSAAIVSRRDRIDPEIRDVTVNGVHATALVVVGGDASVAISLVEDDGDWKLDQLFGTSAPPSANVR